MGTAGPSQPLLAGTAVHVWRVDLTAAGDDVAGSLSADERERARGIAGERRAAALELARAACSGICSRATCASAPRRSS